LSSFSFLFAAIINNPPNHHDLDFGDPHLASLVFITALILLVVILIFMVLVVVLVAIVGDLHGCGFGCSCW
jgi:hypothetical protein